MFIRSSSSSSSSNSSDGGGGGGGGVVVLAVVLFSRILSGHAFNHKTIARTHLIKPLIERKYHERTRSKVISMRTQAYIHPPKHTNTYARLNEIVGVKLKKTKRKKKKLKSQ
uniref:Uncharacterized protein n=1 Tax=Glossina brevipalpis TaxID=37001 RepID=A0A1A9WXU0_9MUSC